MWTDCKSFSYTVERRLKNDFDWILVCKRADWFDIIQVYFPESEITYVHRRQSCHEQMVAFKGDWMVVANFRL